MHRLDLEPARAPTPGLVRRRRRLRHHAFVTGGQGRRQERRGGLAVGGGQPVDALVAPARSESRAVEIAARWAGPADRRRRGAAGRRRTPTAVARRGPPRRRRCGRTARRSPGTGAAAVGLQRDGLGVGDERGRGQRQRGLDDLGQSRRDVVEAAGVDGHRVTARGGSAPARRRAWPRRWPSPPSFSSASATPVAVWASIGPTGRPTTSVNSASARLPAGQRRCGDGREVAASIAARRTSAARKFGRLGDRVGHHPDERALAQFAAEQAPQERLLDLGRRRRRPRSPEPIVGPADPLPATAPISVNAASTPRTVNDGSAAASGSDAQGCPSHADLALRQFAGQPRDDDRDQRRVGLGGRPLQQVGDAADLGRPRGHGTDVGGRGGDVDELHQASLTRRSDIAECMDERRTRWYFALVVRRATAPGRNCHASTKVRSRGALRSDVGSARDRCRANGSGRRLRRHGVGVRVTRERPNQRLSTSVGSRPISVRRRVVLQPRGRRDCPAAQRWVALGRWRWRWRWRRWTSLTVTPVIAIAVSNLFHPRSFHQAPTLLGE